MFSVPDKFLESFYHHYGAEMGMPWEDFVSKTAERDKKDLEELADILYNDVYSQSMPREEFEQLSGLDTWRQEQPNAAQIVGSRVADRATKLAGGAAEAVDSAVDWLGLAFQPTPTAAHQQHAGGQPVRDAEQREDVDFTPEERKAFADNFRESMAASGPVAGAIERGAPQAAKGLREHEGKFEQERYTSWDELIESPLKNFIPYAIEEGIVSLPDMVAAVASLPAYAAARTGEIAGERAENDFRNDADVGDFLAALPAAASSAALERIGASKVFGFTDELAAPVAGEGVSGAAKRIGGAFGRRAATEGVTESMQEPIEQVGASAGTEAWKGKSAKEIGGQLLQGAIQGGVTGALAGGAITTPTLAMEEITRRRQMKDAEPEPTPDATPEPTPTPETTPEVTPETTPETTPEPTPTEPTAPLTSGGNIMQLDEGDRSQDSLTLQALADQGKRMRLDPGELTEGLRVAIDNGTTPSVEGTLKQDGEIWRAYDDEGNMIGTIRTEGDAIADNPLVYSVKEEQPDSDMVKHSEELGRLINSWIERQDTESFEAIKKLRNSKEWGNYPEESRNAIDEIIREGNSMFEAQEAEAKQKEADEKKRVEDEKVKAEQEQLEKDRAPVAIGQDIEVTWNEESQSYWATHKPTGKVFAAGSKKDKVLKDAIDGSNDAEFLEGLTKSPQKPVEPTPEPTPEPEPTPTTPETVAEPSTDTDTIIDVTPVDVAEEVESGIDELDATEPDTMEHDEVVDRLKDLMTSPAFDALPDNVKADVRRYVQSGSGSLKSLANFIGKMKGEKAPEAPPTTPATAEETVVDLDDGTVADETVVEPKATEPKSDPTETLATSVLDNLKAGKAMDNPALFGMADESYGGTVGQGKYDPQDAYNTVEYAMNRYAGEINMQDMDTARAEEVATDLDTTHKLLPTQTRRTDTKIAFQQFSTPPGYAMAVNWAAGITQGDAVLEPSAGAGGLAVMARQMGGKVTVNEIDPARGAVLKKLFGRTNVTAEDANYLPQIQGKEKYDVVVMNPPFSNEGKKGITKKGTVTEKHVLAAMQMVKPGGRLAIISGPSFDVRKGGVVSGAMRQQGTIRAVVGMDGSKIYRKYGTSFDNNVTVWDKTPGGTDAIVEGRYDNLTDFIQAMEPVRNAREVSHEQTRPVAPDEGGGTVLPDESGVETGTEQQGTDVQRPTAPDVGDGESAPDRQPGGSGQRGPGTTGTGGRTDGGTIPGETDRDTVGSGREGGGLREGGTDRPTGSERTGVVRGESVKQESVKLGEEDKYANYKPTVRSLAGATPHPGILVESAAMGTVKYPTAVDYTPDLPEDVVKNGGVSDAQIEKVVLAGNAHKQMIQGGTKRKGFLDGDGTGAGKGRSIVATIYDNYRQGRKKAVWFSISDNLINSSKDDFEGVGWKDATIIPATRKPQWNKLGKHSEGIAFSTYSQLATKLTAGEKNELLAQNKNPDDYKFPKVELLKEWLGEDFDGVIVFDEAHEMKNAIPDQGGRKKEPSRKGAAGLALQNALPNARIYYATATAASEASNVAYLDRLGLWGEQTDFADANAFSAAINAGGTAAMELMARDMKQMGLYASRTLSYEGVEYETLTHDLSSDQTDMYNMAAKAWQTAMANIESALEELMPDADQGDLKRAKAQYSSYFWGANQRFHQLVMTSMQMPSVIQSVEQDVKNGKSVVIQLTNTNEAEQTRQIAKVSSDENFDLEDVDISPRETLARVVSATFPTAMMEQQKNPETGNMEWVTVVDSKGDPVHDPNLVAKKEAFLDEIGQFQLPGNPLDMILHAFGHDNVAEITGRSSRIVSRDGKTFEEKGLQKKKSSLIRSFRDGERRILVFSEAGGTGQSYHAGNEYKNKDQRVHYVLQAGWSADKAMQFLGRTHRTNQANAPIYRLVQTNLPANKRFIATIARRLGQLGAMTRGQRDTAGMFTEDDNLEDTYGYRAVQSLVQDMQNNEKQPFGDTGLTNEDILTKMDLKKAIAENMVVKTFLNRMLNLETEAQAHLFTIFDEARQEGIEDAKTRGEYDTGVEVVKVQDAEISDRKTIHVDEKTGAETEYLKIKAKTKIKKLGYGQATLKTAGFWINRTSGNIFSAKELQAATDPKTGRVGTRFSMRGVKTNNYVMEWDLRDEWKWESVDSFGQAKKIWEEQFEATSDLADTTINMVSGAVLPIYGKLGSEDNLPRVQRVIMDDGSNILGMKMTQGQLSGLFSRLGVESTVQPITAKALYDFMMENNVIATLADGSRISKRRVSGEMRLEVTPDSRQGRNLIAAGGLMEQMGFQFETINYKRTAFVPTSSAGITVLERYMENRRVRHVRERNTNKDVMDEIAFHRSFISSDKIARENKEQVHEELVKIVTRVAPFVTLWSENTINTSMGSGFGTVSGAFWTEYDVGPVIQVALETAADPRKVLRHETIHALRKAGLFSDQEWSVLKHQADKQNWFKKHKIKERYPDLFNGDAPMSMAYEEAIAEAYATWAMDKQSTSSIVTRVFKRITEFFREMVHYLRNFGATPSVNSIFEKVESGEVGRRPISKQNRRRLQMDSAAQYHVEFADPETEKRWQNAAGGVNLTTAGKIREAASDAVNLFTRTYKHLPNDRKSQTNLAQFTEWAYHVGQSSHASKEKIREFFGKVTKGLEAGDVDLITRKWVLDDLLWTAGTGRDVPFGYRSDETGSATDKILADLKIVEAALEQRPDLQDRVDLRNRLRDDVTKQMLSSGVLTAEQAKNPNYFRHQVIEYAEAHAQTARSGKVKNPFWHGRRGSEKDINVNYFQAESEWLFKAYTDIATVRFLKKMKSSKYNILPGLRKEAKEKNTEAINRAAMSDPDGIGKMLQNRNRAIGMSISFLRKAVQGNSDELLARVPAKMKRSLIAFIQTGMVSDAQGDYDGQASIFRLIDTMMGMDMPAEVSRQAEITKASILAKKKFVADTLGDDHVNTMNVSDMLRRLRPESKNEWSVWQPDAKDATDRAMTIYTAQTIPEHVMDRAIVKLDGVVDTVMTPEQAQAIKAMLMQQKDVRAIGGPKEQMVLPVEIAATLNEFHDRGIANMVDQLAVELQGKWKQWMLFNPLSLVRYNLNNVSGDADAILAAGGAKEMTREANTAFREVRNMIYGNELTEDLKAALDMGVIQSSLTMQEIEDGGMDIAQVFNPNATAESIVGKVKQGGKAYFDTVMKITRLRENAFRYAAFRVWKKRLKEHSSLDDVFKQYGYGATPPEIVRGLRNKDELAARLARDMMGDYGNIPVAAKWARRRMIPFVSWIASNTIRYHNLWRNVYLTARYHSAEEGVTKGAMLAGTLAARMFMVYGLVNLWNNLLFDDQEEALSDEARMRLHLNLGQWGDEYYSIRFQGALSDYLAWFGLEDAGATLMDHNRGRADAKDVLTAMAKAPVNKLVQGVTPFFKVPMELATGESWFPDVFNRRTIRDRTRHIGSAFKMDAPAAWTKELLGQPAPSDSVWETLVQAVVYKQDPGRTAFNNVRGLAYDWLSHETGGGGGSGRYGPEADARWALRTSRAMGDEKSEALAKKKLREFGERRPWHELLQQNGPLAMLSTEQRRRFMSTLSAKERKWVQQAQAWHRKTAFGGG